MFYMFVRFLRYYFTPKEEVVEEQVQEAQPAPPKPEPIQLPEWPYKWNKPTPETLATLLEGTVVEGDHIFYVSKLKERKALRIDGSYGNAMILSYWIGGKENPKGHPIITLCGEQQCIKVSHLKLNPPKPKIAPPPPKKKKVVEVRSVPEKKKEPPSDLQPPAKPEENDRTRCQSAKIHYATAQRAQRAQHYHNFWNKKHRTNKKSYAYDCHLCDGWHLTSSNPKKRTYKPPGSW